MALQVECLIIKCLAVGTLVAWHRKLLVSTALCRALLANFMGVQPTSVACTTLKAF